MLSLREEPRREVGEAEEERYGRSGMESTGEEEKRENSEEDVDVFAVIQKKNTIIPSSRSAGETG